MYFYYTIVYDSNKINKKIIKMGVIVIVIVLVIVIVDKLIFNRIAIITYKYTYHMLPPVMPELYEKNNDIHTYDTRNKDLFEIDKY